MKKLLIMFVLFLMLFGYSVKAGEFGAQSIQPVRIVMEQEEGQVILTFLVIPNPSGMFVLTVADDPNGDVIIIDDPPPIPRAATYTVIKPIKIISEE